MSMKPSRKIFIGASAMTTGVLLEFLVAYMPMRFLENVTEQVKTIGSTSGTQMNPQFGQSNLIMATSAIGVISYLLLGAGFLLICIGAYKNAKKTEQLIESLRIQAPSQVP